MTSISIQALLFAFALLLLYIIYGIIYRLYLSPLAHIPGPKLAALTQAYEIYYDLIEKARFPWKIEDLHHIYGPIVRITPTEVHINDPSYADKHFASSGSVPLNKYAPHQNQFGLPKATFHTIDAQEHKQRRGALAPFFSRKSILALEPTLHQMVNKVCARLTEFAGSEQPVDLRLLFSCMTTDIITEYAFPNCFNLLSTPDLSPAWRNSFAEGLRNFHVFKHAPFLWHVLRSIPHSILTWLRPQMKITLDWELGNKKLVRNIIDTYGTSPTTAGKHPTIFHELLSSDLPPEDKSYDRLWQEGASITGAGVETTSNTLNVILYHLTQTPAKLDRLRKELRSIMLDLSRLASWQELEGLPYTSAVITEGLRLAMGVTSRFIRVAPLRDVQYGKYTIPAGYAVSMSILPLHRNQSVYKDPDMFIPERWLGENVKTDLFVFGRGSRMCLGQNLAYAELYLTLAAVVRRFDLTPFETTFSDVEAVCDAFFPMPKEDTKGVRMSVQKLEK